MDSILIIDDDRELCDLVIRFLRTQGFEAEAAHTASAGEQRLRAHSYALIVLDVMLPDLGGFEVLRRVRAGSQVPVLMLTARGDSGDRVLGLEMGADDYLPKPFDPVELAARIRAILRRVSPARGARLPIAAGDVALNPGAHAASCAGTPLNLTGVEFDLLDRLLRDAGQVVTRGRLVRDVLGREFSPFDRSIDTHVYNLRRKLGRLPDGSDRIKGVRGAGYLLAVHTAVPHR